MRDNPKGRNFMAKYGSRNPRRSANELKCISGHLILGPKHRTGILKLVTKGKKGDAKFPPSFAFRPCPNFEPPHLISNKEFNKFKKRKKHRREKTREREELSFHLQHFLKYKALNFEGTIALTYLESCRHTLSTQ